MSTQTAASQTGVLSRPAPWVVAWIAAFFGARILLEAPALATWIRVTAALMPTPIAIAALLSIIRSARDLDELEKRIQIEGLAFGFILSVLLIMTLGLMELAITLNRDDWSYRHVWAMMPMFYFFGVVRARRRYS